MDIVWSNCKKKQKNIYLNITNYNIMGLFPFLYLACVCVRACMLVCVSGDNIFPQRWQYPKPLSLWGNVLVPTRKTVYKSY